MSACMNQSRWSVTIRCESPLHHGSFGSDTGNAVLHRRVPLASNPSHAGVPAVSGNSLRGVLRRIVMRDLLDRCALSRTSGALSAVQWDKLYAALANGGHLITSDVRTDPERMRQLRDAVPPLSVFGAALYSWMLAGRVSIGWLWPVCAETVAAGLCTGPSETLAEDLLTEIAIVRHVDREDQDPAQSGVTPMPVTVEALIPGTVLQGEIIGLARMTALETAVIAWGLGRIAMLGAKGAAGFGRVAIDTAMTPDAYDQWRADDALVDSARTALMTLAQTWG